MKQIKTVTLNPAFDLHYYMESFEAKKENYVQSVLCDAGVYKCSDLGRAQFMAFIDHVNGI